MNQITEEEFDKKYQPIENHIDDNASWSGCMFETFGAEVEFVKQQPENHIWTIVECDDSMVVVSGWHYVNRMGYLITVNPWQDDIEVMIDTEMDDDQEEDIA